VSIGEGLMSIRKKLTPIGGRLVSIGEGLVLIWREATGKRRGAIVNWK
jgi:hypothetical protein